jgi:hypothetical protein
MAYALDWIPTQVFDSRVNSFRRVIDAMPYSVYVKADFPRTSTKVDFAGDAFNNTLDRFLLFRRLSFLAKGVDATPIELETAESIKLLEYMTLELRWGSTDQLLQKTAGRVANLIESRDRHYWDFSASPLVIPPAGTIRAAVSNELPAGLFAAIVNVRVHLMAEGVQVRLGDPLGNPSV